MKKKIEEIALDDLLLDKENPRIYGNLSNNISQENLAEYIFNEFGIDDLKDSILKNGYFPVEPMIVIPDRENEGKYIVIEGNRRLTTIKIICDPKLKEQIVSPGRRDDYNASPDLIQSLQTIPVLIEEDRDSVKSYLGVRHLVGIRKWDAIAQSKYIYDAVLKEKNTHSISVRESLDNIINQTSLNESEVLNHFYKYCIYKNLTNLIQDLGLNASIDNKFSFLEVAFGKSGRSSVSKYIGIERYKDLDPENFEHVIIDDYEDQAKHLIEWMFVKDNPPISESREINSYLKPILKNSVATAEFEKTNDKETALLLSDNYVDIIAKSCRTIHRNLSYIQDYWQYLSEDQKDDLMELYEANVAKKVESTNHHIDYIPSEEPKKE